MNTRDPILMKSVEVLKDCRSLNAAAEMNCPMPRSVEKVPIRNEKRSNMSTLRERKTLASTGLSTGRLNICLVLGTGGFGSAF